jgi:hypothetical protein
MAAEVMELGTVITILIVVVLILLAVYLIRRI